MRIHRSILAISFSAMLALLNAACDDDDPVTPPEEFNGTIHIVDNRFSPAAVTIDVGDSVTWSWEGNNSHSVTHGTSPTVPPDIQKLFDTPIQSSGTFGYRFNNSGTFAYFCRPHFDMGMKGTITVTP